MSFMHFDTMSVVAGLDVITLSGSLAAPNNAIYSSTATSVTAGWNFATLTSGSIQKGSANRRYGTAYTVPKEEEWINNKDFVRQFWIRARHDPLSTGDSLWGTAPTAGPTLDTWFNLDPDDANHEWVWTTTSGTLSGTIEVMIAADNSGAVGTVLATGYYKGQATKTVSGGGGGGGGCFTGNMRILMADGTQKCIADILVGDRIKSYDFRTKKLVNVLVKGTMVPRICDIYEIKLSNGKTIETTVEHPFMTLSGEWANIDPILAVQIEPDMPLYGKLEVGMGLLGADANATITKIRNTGRTETVYHLYDVGEYSNYIVEGICAHNVETVVKK